MHATRPRITKTPISRLPVRAAGRKVYYQPASCVVHFEGQTSGTDLTSGAKRHQVTNQATFAEKWGTALARHRANGINVEYERDRAAKLRVLVIDACMLTPDHDAGSMRMLAILEILTSLNAKVTFVADNLEHRQPYVSPTAAAWRRGAVSSFRALDRGCAVQARGGSSTSW